MAARSSEADRIMIRDAIPEIFSRSYPTLEPDTDMLVALSLLRFQRVDAIPIGIGKSGGRRVAVSGYSFLSQVLSHSREEFGKFLESPCKSFAIRLSTVTAELDLGRLLGTISRTGFGFVCVEERGLNERCSFVGLRDLLGLYDRSIFSSDLSVEDVTSIPLFSLPEDVTLRRALEEMMKEGKRKVLVRGSNRIVSDRSILNHLFSASKLNEGSSKMYDLLETELGEIEGTHPHKINGRSNVREGAHELMRQAKDGCLACNGGIVTSWDLIIKPWRLRRLSIHKPNSLSFTRG